MRAAPATHNSVKVYNEQNVLLIELLAPHVRVRTNEGRRVRVLDFSGKDRRLLQAIAMYLHSLLVAVSKTGPSIRFFIALRIEKCAVKPPWTGCQRGIMDEGPRLGVWRRCGDGGPTLEIRAGFESEGIIPDGPEH